MAEVKIRESNFSDKIPRFRDDELKKQKVVGQGGFGEVVLYQWVDKQSSSSTPMQNVVMKRLLAWSISQKDVKRLEKEAHLLWNISSPFIISLKGLYFGENENEFCIVMEYAPNGSCLDFFRLLGERNRGPHEKIWSLKCRIAYQVIQGMECLHNQKPSKILHLDLKAANVLLDSQLNAKICDFGLSQLHTCTALSRSRASYQKSFGCSGTKKIGGDGTITHIAPEHLQDLNLKSTVKSDVYSFGIFIWELLTCKRPYANAKTGVVMAAVCERQERPNADDIPSTAPAVLLKMMRNSYKQDPKDRPTFTELRLDHGLELESHEAMAKKAVDFILQNSLHNSCWKQKLNTSKSTSAYSSRTNYIYKSCSTNDSGEKQRELKSSSLPQTETDKAALHGKGCMKLVFAIATVLPMVTVLTVLIILFAVNGSSFCFLSGPCDVVADADIDRSLAFSSNSTNENNCKPPSPVTNGELKCTDTTYSTNTLCFVTCQSGYRLSGSNTLLCLKNGSWSQTESQCRNSNINVIRRECPAEDMPLDVIEQHCTDGYYEGSVCQYGCLHNKGIQTRNSRTCSKFGRWSHPIPTCACSGCFGGSGCSERLTWEKLRLQTKQLKKDGVPISITYGDRLITCESDVDVWFFNYDCSCRDSKELRGFVCNNFVNRLYACRHALAMLVRNYVASGFYTAPCDIGSVPANCNS